MANNSGAIVIGANGSVHVAPVGTTMPAAFDEALDISFKEVGYISGDGATFKRETETEEIKVWQEFEAVREVVTGSSFMLDMTLAEWNAITLPLAFGGGSIAESPSASGNFVYSFPDAEEVDERAMVLEWQDGTRIFRLLIPRGKVSSGVETGVKRGEASMLPISFKRLGGGVQPTILTNDASIGA